MRRADRLFQLLQILRRAPRLVTAAALAAELEVSVRTVYRDIQALQAQRVPIEGAAGAGYLLRAGYDLPPLMLTEDEVEALLLGTRIVESWADPELGRAARDLRAKIGAVLPDRLQPRIQSLALAAPPSDCQPPLLIDMALLRRAVRQEEKVEIAYRSGEAALTTRTVWAMSLAFFPPVWLLLGWCELRRDFRSFRLDRIQQLRFLHRRYPELPGQRLVDYLARVEE